ncbi:MAG: DUF4160 domain-containing protein [Prevotellaceae bacterium]|nr:DUF4160 domain-containing protein [Prevotellaceae bacterium]
MPEILRIFGLRFFFYSREHEPIHVHVQGADGKAKFNITPEGIKLVENIGLKPKDIRCAEMVLEENKELAISMWNEYFGSHVTDRED